VNRPDACPPARPDDLLVPLLRALAAELRPFLAGGKTGRIVVHLSGGARARLEIVHFTDVALAEKSCDNEDLSSLRKLASSTR
jgi:hypothetical protein